MSGMLLELNNVKHIPDKLCPLVYSLIYSLFGVTCLKACGYYSGCCAAVTAWYLNVWCHWRHIWQTRYLRGSEEAIKYLSHYMSYQRRLKYKTKLSLGVLSKKNINHHGIFTKRLCNYLVHFQFILLLKASMLFPCNSTMLGGSPYKQPSHSCGGYLPIIYRAALSHTGWPLTKPYQNLWLCNEVKPTGQ